MVNCGECGSGMDTITKLAGRGRAGEQGAGIIDHHLINHHDNTSICSAAVAKL